MSTDLLKDRSYTIVIARSGVSRDQQHPWFNEWIDAQASLIDLAKKCQEFDPDGLTIYELFKKISESDRESICRSLTRK